MMDVGIKRRYTASGRSGCRILENGGFPLDPAAPKGAVVVSIAFLIGTNDFLKTPKSLYRVTVLS